MKNNFNSLFSSLLLLVLFAACSRPVAYFQPSHREHFATTSTPVTPAQPIAAIPTETVSPVTTSTPAEQVAQATATLDQLDAMVRNDNKLAADKTIQKRLNRVRSLLTATIAHANLAPSEVSAPKKMSLMERMMLKKMNKKISRQLAPANPNKTMMNTGILAAGAVVVIVGLILLLVGSSGTAAAVLLLAGGVILLVGLL